MFENRAKGLTFATPYSKPAIYGDLSQIFKEYNSLRWH